MNQFIISRIVSGVALCLICLGGSAWAGDLGPYIVRDINPSGSSTPDELTKVGNRLYFSAPSGSVGREPWISDGTELGTLLLKDINPTGSSNPVRFFDYNGLAVFVADDGAHGVEPWISDGTESGTFLLKDINPAGNSSPSFFVLFNDLLYFAATTAANGNELWVSDGTEEGTKLFLDIHPSASSGPAGLTVMDNAFYFRANDGTNGSELWRSNGSALGTEMLRNINPGGAGSFPGDFAVLGNNLIFSADNGSLGAELWISNGTTVGTVLLKDIREGSSTSSPDDLYAANGLVYFTASDDASGTEPFVTDGTPEGTVLLSNLAAGGNASFPSQFTALGGHVYFQANDLISGSELWKSDGTEEGTVLVKDINPEGASASPSGIVNINGILYFAANDGAAGTELWRSDGTEEGTEIVADIRSGANSSSPLLLTAVGNTLFFTATDAATNRELWAFVPDFELLCPPGRAPNEAGDACLDCPVGSYSPDGLACLDCPTGTISNTEGAITCAPCGPGTAPNLLRNACVSCVPGKYSDNGITCLDCPEGTFTNLFASVICQSCPPGTTANPDRTQCIPCEAGTYTTDSITCLNCPDGTYTSSSGNTQCQNCPEGLVSTADRTACEVPFAGYLRFIGTTTDWHEPTNWSGGEVPGASSDVLLDGSDYIILDNSGGPVTINNLYMKDDALLDLVGGVQFDANAIETQDRAGIELIASEMVAASASINRTPLPGKRTPKPLATGSIKINPSAFGVAGELALSPAAILLMGIGGTSPAAPGSVGEGFYATIAADTITLDGSLQLQLLYDFVPQDGDTFTIINATASLSGQFVDLPEGALVDSFGAIDFYISYSANAVTLTATGSERATFTGADGNWFDPTNWSTGEVPGADRDVVILSEVTIDPALGSMPVSVRDIYLDGGLLLTLPGTVLGYNNLFVGNGELEARSSTLGGEELHLLNTGEKPFVGTSIKFNPTSNDSRAIKIAANTPKGFLMGLGGATPASPGNVGAGFHARLNADEVELSGQLGVELLYDFEPQDGDTFTIISVSGVTSVNGQFADLPEGALVDSFRYYNPPREAFLYISYVGGDGNDVVLTSTVESPEGECDWFPCPAGSVQDFIFCDCVPCPAGTFSPDGDECKPCPQFTYAPDEGSAICTFCSEDTNEEATECFVGEGQCDGCHVCLQGTYFNLLTGECRDCPPGTIAPSLDLTECIACAPGTEPNEDRDRCLDCEAGQYSPDGRDCLPCEANTFSDTVGAADCADCPAGTESTPGSFACMPIPEGEGEGGEGEGSSPDGAAAVAVSVLQEFTTWDVDRDSLLTREEILARIRTLLGGKGVEGESLEGEDAEANALFDELDKNSDDQLSVGELRQTAGALSPVHASDQNGDGTVNLTELLRLIQFYNAEAYGCAENPGNTEDGYDTGAGDESCLPHTSDYLPEDFIITLSELLRAIQFYNSGGLTYCPEESSEDNFCPGTL